MSALGLFGPPNVEKLRAKNDVQGLIKALGYGADSGIRLAAATALGDFKDSRTVAPLVNALGDSSTNVRLQAAEALERTGWQPQGIGDQVALLLATRNWGELRSRGGAAVASLLAALKDEDADTRTNAAATLSAIGEPAVEALTTALEDETRTRGDRIGAAYPLDPSNGVYAYGYLTYEPSSGEGQAVKTAGKTVIVNYVKGDKSLLSHSDQSVARAAQRGEVFSLPPATTSDVRWTLAGILSDVGAPAAEYLVRRLEAQEASDESSGSCSWALTGIGEPAVPALLSSLLRYGEKAGGVSFNTGVIAALAVVLRKPTAKSLASHLEQAGTFSVDANLLLHLARLVGNGAVDELANAIGLPRGRGRVLSMSLWAEDEGVAQQLQTDQYYLVGVLTQDGSETSKEFLQALEKGGSLSFDVCQNQVRGGYDVGISLIPRESG